MAPRRAGRQNSSVNRTNTVDITLAHRYLATPPYSPPPRVDSPREEDQPADGGDRRAELAGISADESSWWKTEPRSRPMAPIRPLLNSSEAQRTPDSMAPAPSNRIGEGGAPDVQESSALGGDGGGGGGGGGSGHAAGAQTVSERSRGSAVVPGLLSKGPGDVTVGLTARRLGVGFEGAQREGGGQGQSAAAGLVAAAETAYVAAHPGATAQASPCCVVEELVGAGSSEEHYGSVEGGGKNRSGEAAQPTLLRAGAGALPAVVNGAGPDDDDVSEPAIGGGEASLFIGQATTGAVVTLGASPVTADGPSVGAHLAEAAVGLAPIKSGAVEGIAGAATSHGEYPSNPPGVALGVSTLTGEAGRSQATAGLTGGDARLLPYVDDATGGGKGKGVGQESWTVSPDLQAEKHWGGVLEGDRSASVHSVSIGAAGDGDISKPAVRASDWKEQGDSAWLNNREAGAVTGDPAGSGGGGGGNSGGGGVIDANRFADPSRRSYDGQAARFALRDRRPSPSATRSHPRLADTAEVGVRSSLPWGWGRADKSQTTSPQKAPPEVTSAGVSMSDQALPTAGKRRGGGVDGSDSGNGGGCGAVGVGRKVVMVDGGEWEALTRENDSLRRQFALAEKR